jgi:predicted dehydrogenase
MKILLLNTHDAAVDFLSAVASGGSIEPNFASGVQILKVLEAGLESARTKKQVVLQPN